MKITVCWLMLPAMMTLNTLPLNKTTMGSHLEGVAAGNPLRSYPLSTGFQPARAGENVYETFKSFVNVTHVRTENGAARDLNSGKALYVSTDFGLTWTPAGGNLPDDATIEVMDKKGGQFVLATEKYGLFIGHPDNPEWKRVGQTLPNQKITALHVADREIYAGVYEAGIFVSRDDGASWQSLNDGLSDLSVRSILKVGGELLVGTNSGLFRSEQGQTRWKKIFVEGQVTSLKTGGGKIAGGTNRGIILSEDEGQSWHWALAKGAVHNVAMLDGQLISMDISGDLRFFRDPGNFWETVHYFPRQYSYIYEMARVGDYMVFSNNYGVHHSEDDGKTWTLVFPNEETVFCDFQVLDQTIYAGTRGWNERRGKSGF